MASKVGTMFDVPEDGVLKTLVLVEISEQHIPFSDLTAAESCRKRLEL
jgi:hypothetical protein